MIDVNLFFAFLAATMVIVATPGPSVALASSQAIRSGPRAVLLCVAGDAAGSAVHVAIATIGLQILVTRATEALSVLQILGGLYILYLAFVSFRDARSDDSNDKIPVDPVRAAWRGFVACVTNPKAIIFFVALFPGFIDPTRPTGFQSLIYGATFITLDAIFIIGYALLFTKMVTSLFAHRVQVQHLSALGLALIGALLVYRGMIATLETLS